MLELPTVGTDHDTIMQRADGETDLNAPNPELLGPPPKLSGVDCGKGRTFSGEEHQKLCSEFGAFTFNASASVDGDSTCSARLFSDKDVSAHRVWINPPFRRIQDSLHHYLSCKKRSPKNTSAFVVVPAWPTAKWRPLLKGMQMVRFQEEPNAV